MSSRINSADILYTFTADMLTDHIYKINMRYCIYGSIGGSVIGFILGLFVGYGIKTYN